MIARRLFGILAFAACAAVACGGASTQQPNDASRAATSGGPSAPDFTIDTIDGNQFHLADHVGKDVVVIDFWTTFCQPCIGALHHLEKMYEQHKGQGFVVLGIAMDPPETAGQVGSFTRSHGLTFPVAHDAQSRVTDLYNKKSSAPYQVLIGRDGRILKIRESFQPGDEVGMEQDVETALLAK